MFALHDALEDGRITPAEAAALTIAVGKERSLRREDRAYILEKLSALRRDPLML